MSKAQEVAGELEIVNPLGLHARAASKLVSLANKFQSDVWLAKGETEVNAKSMLGVLMLACGKGSKVRLRCAGGDAAKCFDALAELVRGGFGEI
ncbi:MAG: HPr family phosphocarrier protein [Myxococcales bacterium]|nr:HPr family phosphocarrier protein [Myxococcales bacterium]MCB9701554.1 HPr family phosphocarrier protein [Myxococcales bacterium]